VQAQASVITACDAVLCLPVRCLETDSSIVACMFISAGNCLLGRCLETNSSHYIVIQGEQQEPGGEEWVLPHVINNMPTYIVVGRTSGLAFVA
jgi:hypothetical protein